jgi:hypothetical protein
MAAAPEVERVDDVRHRLEDGVIVGVVPGRPLAHPGRRYHAETTDRACLDGDAPHDDRAYGWTTCDGSG